MWFSFINISPKRETDACSSEDLECPVNGSSKQGLPNDVRMATTLHLPFFVLHMPKLCMHTVFVLTPPFSYSKDFKLSNWPL